MRHPSAMFGKSWTWSFSVRQMKSQKSFPLGCIINSNLLSQFEHLHLRILAPNPDARLVVKRQTTSWVYSESCKNRVETQVLCGACGWTVDCVERRHFFWDVTLWFLQTHLGSQWWLLPYWKCWGRIPASWKTAIKQPPIKQSIHAPYEANSCNNWLFMNLLNALYKNYPL